MIPQDIHLLPILPEAILSLGLVVLLLVGAFTKDKTSSTALAIGSLTLVIAFVASFYIPSDSTLWFNKLILADTMRQLVFIVLIAATIICLLFSWDDLEHRYPEHSVEYVSLMLVSLLGMLVMVSSGNFIALFVGLEMLSLPLYALTAWRKPDERAAEGALKYFLLGSAAGAMFLMGAVLLFGVSGSFDIYQIFRFSPNQIYPLEQKLGTALVLIAVAFKFAWIPFHSWSPDAYEVAPTPITAWMSTTVKLTLVVFLIRFLHISKPIIDFSAVIWFLAVLTMVGGNLLAAAQNNLKRLFAYSSIAHAGYLLLAFYANSAFAYTAAIYYMLIYLLMNLGVFGIITALNRKTERVTKLADLAGLAKQHGWLSFFALIFFTSLAGLPPLAGFTAKWFLFSSAIQAGALDLVVIAVLSSVVAAYYYLKPIIYIYFYPATPAEQAPQISGHMLIILALLAIGLVVFGFLPHLLFDQAIRILG